MTDGIKVTINYSFKSIPEDPLFFDCFRGEIGGMDEVITRVQRYLFEKEVFAATEKRASFKKPVENKWKKKRR